MTHLITPILRSVNGNSHSASNSKKDLRLNSVSSLTTTSSPNSKVKISVTDTDTNLNSIASLERSSTFSRLSSNFKRLIAPRHSTQNLNQSSSSIQNNLLKSNSVDLLPMSMANGVELLKYNSDTLRQNGNFYSESDMIEENNSSSVGNLESITQCDKNGKKTKNMFKIKLNRNKNKSKSKSPNVKIE